MRASSDGPSEAVPGSYMPHRHRPEPGTLNFTSSRDRATSPDGLGFGIACVRLKGNLRSLKSHML